MIDERNKIIYVDYSTLAVFAACKEKCRLGSVRGWRKPELSLSFGHAIHAGWAAYYDALAGGFRHDGKWQAAKIANPLVAAKAAFVKDIAGTAVPITVEEDERRSLERGMALIEGYVERWKNEPYDNILRKDGSPLVEMGFKFYLCQYKEYAVWVVGYIDRVMRNRYSGRATIDEGKTTTQALSQYVTQVKPNHQITIYFAALQKMAEASEEMRDLGLGEVRECIWDCVYVSDRKPNYGKSLVSPLMMFGVDIEKDYARQITTRSKSDITAVLQDLEEIAIDYCAYITSSKTRWPRTAPGACHAFGGCKFRNRCSMNIDEVEELAFMSSEGFVAEPWEPWRQIVNNE